MPKAGLARERARHKEGITGVKFQIPNSKSQINANDQISKSQTRFVGNGDLKF
jgi:hypothetical protein